MKKNRIRINLDISPELAEMIKKEAEKQDIAVNALIRIALNSYLENKKKGIAE